MIQEKEKEYQVSLERGKKDDKHQLEIAFRTLREFTTFQYNLQIEDSSKLSDNHFQFKIGGMIMPLAAMPSTGHAMAKMKVPFPTEGIYMVEFIKKTQRNMFRIEITTDDMKVIEIPEEKQFVELLVKRD